MVKKTEEQKVTEVCARVIDHLKKVGKWHRRSNYRRALTIINMMKDEAAMAKAVGVSRRRMALFTIFFANLVLEGAIKGIARATKTSREKVTRRICAKYLKK